MFSPSQVFRYCFNSNTHDTNSNPGFNRIIKVYCVQDQLCISFGRALVCDKKHILIINFLHIQSKPKVEGKLSILSLNTFCTSKLLNTHI
jgi:hypothetical protein